MDDKHDGRYNEPDDNSDDRQSDADPGLSLHMKLGGAGDPVEPDYSAQGHTGSGRLPERDDEVDTGVALHMKLGGAGDPLSPDDADGPARDGGSAIEGSRLCPGCNVITEFRDSTCPECGFRFRAASGDAPPAFDVSSGMDAPASSRIMLIVMVVVLVGLLAFVISRIDFSSMGGSSGTGTTADTEVEEPFIAVQVDDEFNRSLSETLVEADDVWSTNGIDAHIYRYRVESSVEPGVSQYIRLTCFVGGADAADAIAAEGSKLMNTELEPYFSSYRSRTGLEYVMLLEPAPQEVELTDEDHYIRWGYHYGREHQDEVDQVTNAIESYREREGQYPRSLNSVSANMHIENRGFSFIPGGWGYLPIFETDSAGNVPFGSGSASAELYPRRISGYYLVRFLSNADIGVDLLSDEGKTYYLNRISPLPCVQKSKLQNVPIEPDGEPDGIAWAVKNGSLLDV